MGIHVNVFRWSLGDCTNNGLSQAADYLTVVNAEGPSEPTPDAPAVYALPWYGGVKLVPARRQPHDPEHPWVPNDDGVMFGGNYAATSDSRWAELLERLTGNANHGAVPIHDRREW